ncbi:sulfatase-like hydrolase/transferase [Zobellia roscoffensis]|uniref:sulfatase-like hydrolase/transferase n=1 Tax=Zobellia roscoffensis TaxID=2779508 RepID=UPI00188A2668|nr:sulfatase-like hydrolase/transferase [Zobellia roscoffensis]
MLQHNGKRVKLKGYMTDDLGDIAVNFINKKSNKPFFMYLSFNAVHTPMEAKEEDLAKFKGHPRQALAAMTWSLDENIVKVVQALKNKGVVENTLIFFLSDNGGAHNNQSSTGPLKGWKGNKFEGGHRVPLVVSWPGQLPSGNSLDGLTSSLDIFSTAVKAANIEVDDELILDGVNLLPYLKKLSLDHLMRSYFGES